jgi:hypothetical protein
MPVRNTPQYAPCPSCRALNMEHRTHCYKCQKPLSGPLWTDTASGSSPSFAPRPVPGERRRNRRHVVNINGAFMDVEGIARCRGTIHTISQSGLQFRTMTPCRAGARVRLDFPLEGQVWFVEGVIRNVRPIEEGATRVYACGIRFTRTNDLLRQLISRLS